MKLHFIAMLAIAAFATGCSPTSTSPAPDVVSAGATVSEISIELLSIKDVPTQLAARKGKVVVLDMWATW